MLSAKSVNAITFRKEGKTNSILNFTSKWDLKTDIHENKNLLHECEHIENYNNNILNFYSNIILSIMCSNVTNSHIISLRHTVFIIL